MEIKFPVSYDRGLCAWSQKGRGVMASTSLRGEYAGSLHQTML